MTKYIAYIFFIVATHYFEPSFSQQSFDIIISPGGDTIITKPIPLLEISPNIVDFNAKMNSYKEELITIKEINEIDSSAIIAREYLIAEKTKLVENLDKLTLIKVENTKREWQAYKNTLNNWQSTITNRIADIEASLFNLQVTMSTWELTRKSKDDLNIPNESLARIREVIINSNKLINALKQKQDSIIIIQNRITDFQIMVDEAIVSLEEYKKDLQSQYFSQDSPPVWRSGDSTMNVSNAIARFKLSIDEHTKSIELFWESNYSNAVKHLIIFLLILFLFFYLNLDFRKHAIPDKNDNEKIKYFLSNYFLSSFLLSISLSQLIYSNTPIAVFAFMSLLLLALTILLHKAIIPGNLKPLFYLIVFLYLIDEIHIFFTAKTLLTRSLMLLQDALYIWIMYKLLRKNSPFRKAYEGQWLKSFINIIMVLIILAVFSLLGNVFGYVNLSIILSNALVNVLLLPIILNLLFHILKTLFTSLFKTKLLQSSKIINLYEKQILNTISQLLIYFAIFLWIRSIFVALGLAEQAGNWIYGLLDEEWKLGSVKISFGSLIAFFLAILITSVVAKGLKYFLEVELFPRLKLGRGVPGAISMIVRYTLVAFGIYIALSAAGVDLGQFGLIAGALGVGIGFGLQGVVYNFIAGLILAFERPIQKGDTIEIGNLLGDVKNIGVRASTIRTYDGSDVIVPNGNLISKELINWTLSDRSRRREVKVRVAYGTDPHQVFELLSKVTSENENVLPFPKPWPLFEGFGDSSLNFRVLFWVNFDQGLAIQSAVAMNIYDALIKAEINIPFQQTDLHVRTFDPTIQETILPFKTKKTEKAIKKTPEIPKKKQ